MLALIEGYGPTSAALLVVVHLTTLTDDKVKVSKHLLLFTVVG
jgi:hypothetical protein